MKRVYVILAIVGAILPYVFLTQFFIHEGLNLMGFLSALFANPPGFRIYVRSLIHLVRILDYDDARPKTWRQSQPLWLHRAECDGWAVLCSPGIPLCQNPEKLSRKSGA